MLIHQVTCASLHYFMTASALHACSLLQFAAGVALVSQGNSPRTLGSPVLQSDCAITFHLGTESQTNDRPTKFTLITVLLRFTRRFESRTRPSASL
jgi:hypothetical protein